MTNENDKPAKHSVETESIESKEVVGLSQGQIVRKRFVRHRAAMVSLVSLAGIILFVFTASGIHLGSEEKPFSIPGWWQYGITDIDEELSYEDCPGGSIGCPTLDLVPAFIDGTGMQIGKHPFGQDDIGRDYFALVMRGAQQSIVVMLTIGILGGLLGTIIGAIAGYFRGWVDAVLMRLTDFIITIPIIILGSVIGFRFGNLGVMVLALMLGFFSWTGLARLVRAEFLSLREREFVDAARIAGASNARIIRKHILPNAVGVIIVSITLLMSSAILLETGLSYLGFGVVSPDVSLGLLISTYQDAFPTRPWLFWYPGLFIIAIALAVNFIGDGLRDAFDPRQKRTIRRSLFKKKA